MGRKTFLIIASQYPENGKILSPAVQQTTQHIKISEIILWFPRGTLPRISAIIHWSHFEHFYRNCYALTHGISLPERCWMQEHLPVAQWASFLSVMMGLNMWPFWSSPIISSKKQNVGHETDLQVFSRSTKWIPKLFLNCITKRWNTGTLVFG